MRTPQTARLAALLAVALPLIASAQAPLLLGYQGRLLKSDGTPETGSVQMKFSFYPTDTGGSSAWDETQSVALTDGYYATYIGRVTTLNAALFDASTQWLEVATKTSTDPDFKPMTPRQRVGSVAYALNARSLKGGTVDATSISVGGNVVIDNTGRLSSTAGYIAGNGIAIDSTTRAISLNSSGCASGQVLQYNGTNFGCATVSGGGGGSLTSITAGTGLTGGTITSSGTIGVNFGATAGTVAQGNDARFGVATALRATNLSTTAPTTGQVLGFDGTNWTPVAAATGTVTSVTAGTGLAGGAITGTGTIAIADGGVGTTQLADNSVTAAKLASNGCTANQVLQWNGTSWVCADLPASQSQLRQFSVVMMMKSGTNCPAGFTADPIANWLGGGNNTFYANMGSKGLYMGGSNGMNYYQRYIYMYTASTSMANTATVCWKTYQTRGHPLVHFMGYTSATACSGTNYFTVPVDQLRGNNAYAYMMSNSDGFFLGYLDSWGYAAQSVGDTYQWRYWNTGLGGDITNACFKVMGVESDPTTANGVFPVVLGVKGPALCPAGYTYRAYADTQGNNDNTYLSMSESLVAMGGLYTWGYTAGSYQQEYWQAANNVNYCYKFYPMTGTPSVTVRALNGFNCPTGDISLDVSAVNGSNNNAYVIRDGSGLFIGGLAGWSVTDYVSGGQESNITTSSNKICYNISNVSNWP